MDFTHKHDITFIQRLPQTKPINFSDLIIPLASIQNMRELRYILEYLPSFNELTMITDINIFKSPIKPLWEDENNLAGGKYIIKVKRAVGQRLFEKLTVNFMNLENVNGIVASIRKQQVMLSVWVRSAADDKKKFVREMRSILNVGYDLIIEFKDNDESLKDNSSFRNTAVFRDQEEVNLIRDMDAVKLHKDEYINRKFTHNENQFKKHDIVVAKNSIDNEQKPEENSEKYFKESGVVDKKQQVLKIEINKSMRFDERQIINEPPRSKFNKQYGKGGKGHFKSNLKDRRVKQQPFKRENIGTREDATNSKVQSNLSRSSNDDVNIVTTSDAADKNKKDKKQNS